MFYRAAWLLAATLTTAFGHAHAAAQAWPAKPGKLVVPQAAGGATDVFARFLGQKLSVAWGQPVAIENRAGAAGVIGTDAVVKAAPTATRCCSRTPSDPPMSGRSMPKRATEAA